MGTTPSEDANDGRADHVLLTRFNLPSVGPESLIRAQDGWLQDRIELFERFTVPSVRAQTRPRSFGWLVFFDRESPAWLIERIRPLVDDGVFRAVYGEQFTNEEVVDEARNLTGARSSRLLTSTLDNDDALAVDFVERVQHLAEGTEAAALYLANGLIRTATHAYLRHDPHNAFASVVEPWHGARTVWRDWHNMLHRHMPVRVGAGEPGWLQVVHGRNVSNRVRGRLVDPTVYDGLFPGHLEDLSVPTAPALAYDRLIRIPTRETGETLRRAGKSVILHTLGRDGLDRVKERLQRSTTR